MPGMVIWARQRSTLSPSEKRHGTEDAWNRLTGKGYHRHCSPIAMPGSEWSPYFSNSTPPSVSHQSTPEFGDATGDLCSSQSQGREHQPLPPHLQQAKGVVRRGRVLYDPVFRPGQASQFSRFNRETGSMMSLYSSIWTGAGGCSRFAHRHTAILMSLINIERWCR